MKNSFKLLILILLISVSGCGREVAHADKKTQLTVGISADYPPFEFLQQGQVVGLDVDITKAIAKELGKTIQIQEMAFNSLIPALQAGKIDIALSGITATPERQKHVDFSVPYYQNSIAIVYSQGKPEPQLNDFDNKKIGVQLGTTLEKWIKQTAKPFPNAHITTLDNNLPLIEKLKLGQLDYVIIETIQAIEFCKANPTLTFKKMAIVEEGCAIALAKNSPLLGQINSALASLQQNGTLQQLTHQWIQE